MFKRVLGILALIVAIPFAVSAQSNSIQVTAGASNFANNTAVTTQVEYTRAIDDRFTFKNAFGFAAIDSDRQAVANRAVLRGFLTDNVFVGAGATVGKTKNRDVTVNPTFEGGAVFNIDRVTLEPRAQLDTTDLLSSNQVRSLSAQMKVLVELKPRFGLVGIGGVRSNRTDNKFFIEGFGSLQKFVSGGVYFEF